MLRLCEARAPISKQVIPRLVLIVYTKDSHSELRRFKSDHITQKKV